MIISFSGTGNSAKIAGHLASILSDKIVKVDINLLRLISEGETFTVGDPDRIIWVFPVYAWGLPKVVSRVIQTINLSGATPATTHWMVATCGDDIGLTAEQWRRELRQRNFHTVAAFSVAMPNTYVFLPGFELDSHAVATSKLEAMPSRVATIAAQIDGYTSETATSIPSDSVVRGAAPWIKSRILRPLFDCFLTSPEGFHVDLDHCTRCGRCSHSCPLDNITIDRAKGPQWGRQCTFCTACFHACPEHAIGWSMLRTLKKRY